MHPDLEPREALGRRLRELQDPEGAPYDFREFERRSRQRDRAGPGLSGGRAAAATAVLVLGLLALWIRLGGGSAPSVRPQAARPDAPVAAAARRADPDPQQLRWLESLPQEPAVVRVGTHCAVTRLEDRIAQLDDLLSVELLDEARPAQRLALQQERTRLLGALLEVRYAETLADESR